MKEALRRSRAAEDYRTKDRQIYDSTFAVIFLGTPHRGSRYASWGVMAQNIAKASGFDANAKVLRDLDVDSGTLDMLSEEFSKMLKAEKFQIFTFQEGMGYKGVQILNAKVSELSFFG